MHESYVVSRGSTASPVVTIQCLSLENSRTVGMGRRLASRRPRIGCKKVLASPSRRPVSSDRAAHSIATGGPFHGLPIAAGR